MTNLARLEGTALTTKELSSSIINNKSTHSHNKSKLITSIKYSRLMISYYLF